MSDGPTMSSEATDAKKSLRQIQAVLDGVEGQAIPKYLIAPHLIHLDESIERLDEVARARLVSHDALTEERDTALQLRANAEQARDVAERKEDEAKSALVALKSKHAVGYLELEAAKQLCRERLDTIDVQRREMADLETRALNLQNRLAQIQDERDQAIRERTEQAIRQARANANTIMRDTSEQTKAALLRANQRLRRIHRLHKRVLVDFGHALDVIGHYQQLVAMLEAEVPPTRPCRWCGEIDGEHLRECPRSRGLASQWVPENLNPVYDLDEGPEDDSDEDEQDDDDEGCEEEEIEEEPDNLDDVPF